MSDALPTLIADNHVYVVGPRAVGPKLQTDLLLGLAVVWLHLQNPLEAAAGSHGVSKRQVALALSQVALWVRDLEVQQAMTSLNSYPFRNQLEAVRQSFATSVPITDNLGNHGKVNTANTV